MKLVRFGATGQERTGIIDGDGKIRDVSSLVTDWNGHYLSDRFLGDLSRENIRKFPLADEVRRIGPCIGSANKIVGVAINYHLHGTETGSKIPQEPTLFLKAPSSISGANDPIELPPGSEKLDWEVELGVVIGSFAKNITAQDALQYVAGYCVLDDVSERAFQLEHGGQQHTKGKSYDSFCPIGPWLVTRDEVPDPQNLKLWTDVNGHRMQDGNTKDMIFPVTALISYISKFMTLMPGDIIATGTPDGVGRGRNPPFYLKAGDLVELGIEGLGLQTHKVVSI